MAQRRKKSAPESAAIRRASRESERTIVVPDGLFAPQGGVEQSGPATRAMISRTEKALNIKLPGAYRAVMRVRNGGTLHLSTFKLARRPPRLWSSLRTYHVDGLPGMCPQPMHCLLCSTRAHRRSYGLPRGLFVLTSGDRGHWCCCLDYRKCGPSGEPSVMHISLEEGYEFEVASSFAELLAGLHRTSEQRDPAVIALDGELTSEERLHATLRKMGCRTRRILKSWRRLGHPAFPSWTWSKYRSYVRGLPAWIQAEPNQRDSSALLYSAAHNADHPMLTIRVAPTQAKKCLEELLCALGPSAVLIRSVE